MSDERRTRCRQVRTDEVTIGATYHLANGAEEVRLLGPVYVDANGYDRTTPTPDAFYFGCHRGAGHYLWRPTMRLVWDDVADLPPTLRCPDGVFPPNAGQRQRIEIEGEAALHHVEGSSR